MKVRMQTGGFEPPVQLDGVRSTVVSDDFGNPLIVAQMLGKEGVTVIYTHKDPEFRRVLKTLGIGLNAKYQEITHAIHS